MQMSGNSIARKVHGIPTVTVNSRILLLRAILFYLFGREFVLRVQARIRFYFRKNTITFLHTNV